MFQSILLIYYSRYPGLELMMKSIENSALADMGNYHIPLCRNTSAFKFVWKCSCDLWFKKKLLLVLLLIPYEFLWKFCCYIYLLLWRPVLWWNYELSNRIVNECKWDPPTVSLFIINQFHVDHIWWEPRVGLHCVCKFEHNVFRTKIWLSL